MKGIERVRDVLLSIDGIDKRVWHFFAHDRTPPYIVWAEDSQGDSVSGDGAMVHQAISGTVDLFSADLDDVVLPMKVQEALNSGGIAWRLNSVQYEDDTGLKHLEWVWKVPAYG